MKKSLFAMAAVSGLALGLGANAEHEASKTADHAKSHLSPHKNTFTEFPPRNAEGNIEFHPEFYWSNTDYPYIFHGGYWWFPSEDGALLEGYEPYAHEGRYWYPSMQHPHVFYITDKPLVFVYPHFMDKPMDDAMGSPMEKVHENAPGK